MYHYFIKMRQITTYFLLIRLKSAIFKKYDFNIGGKSPPPRQNFVNILSILLKIYFLVKKYD